MRIPIRQRVFVPTLLIFLLIAMANTISLGGRTDSASVFVAVAAAVDLAVFVGWDADARQTDIERFDRWRNRRCIECDYIVRGLDVCPECGAVVADRYAPRQKRRWEKCLLCGFLNAPKRTDICFGCGNPLDLSSIVQCVRCGYDLRGIDTDVCPECGDRALERLP